MPDFGRTGRTGLSDLSGLQSAGDHPLLCDQYRRNQRQHKYLFFVGSSGFAGYQSQLPARNARRVLIRSANSSTVLHVNENHEPFFCAAKSTRTTLLARLSIRTATFSKSRTAQTVISGVELSGNAPGVHPSEGRTGLRRSGIFPRISRFAC